MFFSNIFNNWFKKNINKKSTVTLNDILNDLGKPVITQKKSNLQVVMDYVNFIKMLELEEYYLSNDPSLYFKKNNCYVVVRPEVIFRCNFKN